MDEETATPYSTLFTKKARVGLGMPWTKTDR